MSNSRILEKIQKCMALSESSNAAEAAAGLRQAQKLMAKHNLNASDLELHTVSEAVARGATKAKTLPVWVAALRCTIAEVFNCEVINRCWRMGGTWYNYAVFIGVGEKPAAAQYTYEVLFRQITSDRNRFKGELQLQLTNSAKTRRCDLFCEAWISAVRDKVERVAMSDQDKTVVDRFKEKTYGDIPTSKSREQEPPKNLQEIEALFAGEEAGQKAQLFRGVNAREADKQLG